MSSSRNATGSVENFLPSTACFRMRWRSSGVARSGAQPHQRQFHHGARLEVLVHVVVAEGEHDVERRHQPRGRQVGHRVAAALPAFEHAHQRQRLQRLAQRRPGDAEGDAHLLLGRQPVAGLEVAGLDHRHDAVRDLLGDRAALLQRPADVGRLDRPARGIDQLGERVRAPSLHPAPMPSPWRSSSFPHSPSR